MQFVGEVERIDDSAKEIFLRLTDLKDNQHYNAVIELGRTRVPLRKGEKFKYTVYRRLPEKDVSEIEPIQIRKLEAVAEKEYALVSRVLKLE